MFLTKTISMLKNFFTIAWRNLTKNKVYAFINIIGLSSGIACAILIYTIVTYQLSFDGFHRNADRIYRIVTEFHNETIEYQPGVPQPLGNAFRNDFSFVEKSARVKIYKNALVSFPDDQESKKFQEEDGVAYAEPEFFDLFNFPIEKGNPKTALIEPNSAIITQKLATKYFGSDNPLGRIIRYDNKTDFKVTGVLKNIPGNTHRRQEIYLSYVNLKDKDPWYASDSSWGSISSSMNFFIKLKPGIAASTVENAFQGFEKKYFGGDGAKTKKLRLQPLSDIHFNADFDGSSNKRNLWALGFIGLFLVITACMNFINLATAQALNRAKEVGLRKVMGSLRSQLFWQFIIETGLIVISAFLLAYGLAQTALPYLNRLIDTRMAIDLFRDARTIAFFFMLLVAVIFLSGSYPGFILSAFQPILALKGKLSQKQIGGFSLRRILVITQFTISQMMIIGMIVIFGQIHYSKTTDLGFNKDAVVLLPLPQNDRTKMNTLSSRLSNVGGTENITLCSQPPASSSNGFNDLRYDNHFKDESWEVNVKYGDAQYVPTFGLKLVSGRNFFPSDTLREYLVNESLVRKLGIRDPATVVGKRLSVNDRVALIAGVIKDFHNNSLHGSIDPIVILPQYNSYRFCSAKINLANLHSVLAAYEKIWTETYPDYVYSYQFLDERIAKFYKEDTIILRLVEGFAGIAILVGCLGLYGLISFMAAQKTREISVRKVLGASLDNILWLFGKEFSRLLLIAFVIAAPIAWLVMNKWLQDFQYRIQISWEIFGLAILSTFAIALLTVGYRSVKAAVANPVKSLRSE
jgi:putative ABC transport system permease protein